MHVIVFKKRIRGERAQEVFHCCKFKGGSSRQKNAKVFGYIIDE